MSVSLFKIGCCCVAASFVNACTVSGVGGQTTSGIDASGADAVGIGDTNGATTDGSLADGPIGPIDAGVQALPDFCPTTATFKVFDAAEPFRKYSTGNFGDRPPYEFSATFDLHGGEDLVVQLDVRSATSTSTGLYPARLEFIDIGANRAGKLVTISRSRCDYRATANWVSPAPVGGNAAIPSNGGGANFSINETGRPDAQFNLTTGTWYLNVKIPLDQCPSATPCNVVEAWAN